LHKIYTEDDCNYDRGKCRIGKIIEHPADSLFS